MNFADAIRRSDMRLQSQLSVTFANVKIYRFPSLTKYLQSGGTPSARLSWIRRRPGPRLASRTAPRGADAGRRDGGPLCPGPPEVRPCELGRPAGFPGVSAGWRRRARLAATAFASGHTSSNTPGLIRTRKLSGERPG